MQPIPAYPLRDCSELEAGLVVHWLSALNDAGDGFSGYRDNATKTNSLLNRIYDIWLPDPSEEAVQAALDRQIAFTDDLIDQVVYRLYGLSEDEVAVVEGS